MRSSTVPPTALGDVDVAAGGVALEVAAVLDGGAVLPPHADTATQIPASAVDFETLMSCSYGIVP
jgi:hypothetical protein